MSHFEMSEKLLRFLTVLPLFIISATVHEFAHAAVAAYYGDTTAKLAGRKTLNPLKHIDIFGTILMPLLSFASGFALLGWAKPVPVNRANFRDPIKNDLYVSAAGPLSNLLLAILSLLVLIVLKLLHITLPELFYQALVYSIYFNVFLCFFNLLPLPPLDGSHILFDLFPNEYTARLLRFGLYGSILIMLLINTPVFGYFLHFVYLVTSLFIGLYKIF
jgi:Zn-dependent protease